MTNLQKMLNDIEHLAFFDIDFARRSIVPEMEKLEQWLREVTPQYDLADPDSPIMISRGEEADKGYKYALTTRYMCVRV
jgi:hypothetical protein